MTEETLKLTFNIILLFNFCLKVGFDTYYEKSPTRFGHTTGLVIVIGAIMSYILLQWSKSMEHGAVVMRGMQFSDEFFFDFVLPAIVFPSGYNMRRKKFF
jgi:hypothetical protein